MKKILVALFILTCALFVPQKAKAQGQCKLFGGTTYDICYPAPVSIRTRAVGTSSPYYIFPSVYAAAQWRGQQLYASGGSWGKCQYGVKTDPNPCGTQLISGFGCRYLETDPNYSHNSRAVSLWGYGPPYSSTGTSQYLTCSENSGSISFSPKCPKGWGNPLGYPYGVDRPLYYCGTNNITNNGTTDTSSGTPNGPSTADKTGTCNACGVNPVNLVTGAKYDAIVDYQNYSPFPIKLVRYYSNAASGWHFNYDIRIESYSRIPSSNVAYVTALREDGTRIIWKSTDADESINSNLWHWTAQQKATSKTILSALEVIKPIGSPVAGYQIKNLRDQIEKYDADGKLTTIEDTLGRELAFQYNANGALSKVTDDAGRHLDFSYAQPATYTNTWGNSDTSSPDPTVDENYEKWNSDGDEKSFRDRKPTNVTDGAQSIHYTYDVDPDSVDSPTRLLSIEQADGSIRSYNYVGPSLHGERGWLTGIIGEDGQPFANYTYNSSYRVSESTHGAGLRKITYNITGQTVKDAYNNSFFYGNASQYVAAKPTGFSNNPCPPEVCSGEGAQLKAITWDVYGNPLTKTDYNNRVTTLTWDGPRALPLTITQATGTVLARTTTFTWHATKRLPLTKVEPIRVGSTDGTRTTTWAYDSNGLLLSETQTNSLDAQTRVRSFTYNAMGLVETATDARGKITEYAYDTQGNLLTQENALGQTTTWSSYTLRGLPGKMVDPNGLETVMTYDARDRVTQIKRGSATLGWETWNVSWLPIGKIDRITRPDGISYKLLYDSAHDLIEMQERSASDALLGKRVFTLDLMGRLTLEEAFDANGVKIASGAKVWNTLSRLYQSKGAQNQTTTLTYDADGNLTGVSDPLTHTNGATVDALGRTVTTIDALNKTSTLAYDVQDNLVSATDARSVATGYGYNAFNDLLAISSQDRGSWAMSVDANGNTIQTTDPRGAEATVVYDDLDRPTSMTWLDDNVSGTPAGFTAGDKTATYTWDTCTNGIGRLCAKTDWTGTYGYSYDAWGRLNGESFLPIGESFSLANGYSFDSTGRLTTQTYPSGKSLTFTYGSNGRVSGMDWAGSALTSNMAHQPMGGPVLGWTWAASGIPSTKSQVAYTYDLDGRMTHISDIEEIELTYDAANRLGAVAHQPDADPDMAYTYDNKDRLTQADNSTWTAPTSYAYDFGDNRTSRTQGTGSWVNAYGVSSNRLNTTTPHTSGVPGSTTTLSYDAMGNLINDGSKTFSYDAAGRMVSVNAGATGATYQVNAGGLRVRKDVTGVGAHQEIVAYNGARQRVGVYTPNGSGGFDVEEELVYAPGSWRLMATVRGQIVSGADGVAYPILADQIGTPRVVLDPATGDRRWAWNSKEAFGDTVPNGNPDSLPGGSFAFNARFPGQFLDVETGLFHNGYRDYDARLGRYVQSDPIGLGGGWNTYGYVGGNPTASSDVTGLYFTEEALNDPQFMQAITFLESYSPTAAAIIDKARRDPRPMSLKTTIGNSEFKPSSKGNRASSPLLKFLFGYTGGTVYWNKSEAYHLSSCDSNGSSASIPPALTLLHEIDHFNESADFYTYFMNEINTTEDPHRWTDGNEKVTIGRETKAAQELGWGTRSSHNASYKENPYTRYSAKTIFSAYGDRKR